jgi:hypothetical protein
MRKSLGFRLGLASLAIVTMFTILPSAARAGSITFQNGPGGTQAQIDNIDFAAGNAVAKGGTNISLGSTLTTYYQANVGDLSNGGVFQFTSTLNSKFFLTAVYGVTEKVSSLGLDSKGNTIANFGLASGAKVNYLDIYANKTGSGKNGPGTGFNATGTLILHAQMTEIVSVFSDKPDGTHNVPFATGGHGSNYPKTKNSVGVVTTTGTAAGAGGFNITAQILFANSDWFPSISGNPTINFIIPTGNLKDEFTGVDASKQFVVGSTFGGGSTSIFKPTPGNVNGLPAAAGGTGKDVLFQVNASASFSSVPEPSTFVLLSFGVVLVGGIYSIRRMKALKRAAVPNECA